MNNTEGKDELQDLLDLNPKQQKAFNKLVKAYKLCESLNIEFYNNYGTIGAYDKAKISAYNDTPSDMPHGNNYGVYNANEFNSVDSWADDQHYFHKNPKYKSK